MITLQSDDFAERMTQQVNSRPALYSVQYAVTYRCNVACVHCYAHDADVGAPPKLAMDEVRRIFREAADLGCLHCTVTGGEPLLHPEFETIWTILAELGIRRLLFTNATLATDRVAGFLRDMPPDWVEVTLLGADAATHEAITRRPGSFDAALAGIRRLERAGVRVRVKTIVMRNNAHQIGEIKALAETLGDGSFRLDGQLMGDYRGCLDIDSLRVPVEDLVRLENLHGMSTEEAWCHEETRLAGFRRDRLYACGAGRRSAYLSPWGGLHPCLSAAHIACSLREHSVSDAWRILGETLTARSFPADHPCRDCDAFVYCQNCPAAAKLDTGDERGISSYRCKLAKARQKRFSSSASKRSGEC
ncbi:MAG: radical SAM protein [Kiritimatiellia bacterium]